MDGFAGGVFRKAPSTEIQGSELFWLAVNDIALCIALHLSLSLSRTPRSLSPADVDDENEADKCCINSRSRDLGFFFLPEFGCSSLADLARRPFIPSAPFRVDTHGFYF